ncbi:hypothetical protein LINPERPRIM_LOCUS29302 [Linum perenne]
MSIEREIALRISLPISATLWPLVVFPLWIVVRTSGLLCLVTILEPLSQDLLI